MNIESKVVLKKGKEFSVERFHPWVFSGAVQKIEGSTRDGVWAEVVDFKNKTLGFGHYQNGSIAVRLLLFQKEKPISGFWEKKIEDAVKLRSRCGLPSVNTNAYRLIHGEGDGLPGLIVDYYNGVVVLQAHSSGMYNDRLQIAEAIKQVMGNDLLSIFYKSHATSPGKLRNADEDEYLFGATNVPHGVVENDNKFYVDWESGQKTGFFLDQRENRKLLGFFSKGKSILNTFCYTGGFSVYALQAGASRVHSVDASERAVELTRRNIELNGFDSDIHACYAADTFEYLKNKHNEYDVIILDPPAFAKHRDARHQAVKGYQRLNVEAMKAIKPGGIIFTFSCSQVVDKQLFYNTVVSAAIQAGRDVKVLHHLSQPPDHPVSMFHSEGEYLKGLVLCVL